MEIYSPASVGIRYIGRKAITAIAVAPKRGIAVFLAGLVKASYLFSPFSRLVSVPSTTTMALSTSIPIAIMNEPRETLCISILTASIYIKVPSMERISPLPIIRPLLIPIVNKRTPTTTTTEAIRLLTNCPIAFVTRSG